MAEPETAARHTYTTDWTPKGHRLYVEEWSASLVLSCQSELMDFEKRRRTAINLGQITVPTWSSRGEVERLVGHCFGYFQDDELVLMAVKAVRDLHAKLELAKPPPKPSPSQPPQDPRTN